MFYAKQTHFKIEYPMCPKVNQCQAALQNDNKYLRPITINITSRGGLPQEYFHNKIRTQF